MLSTSTSNRNKSRIARHQYFSMFLEKRSFLTFDHDFDGVSGTSLGRFKSRNSFFELESMSYKRLHVNLSRGHHLDGRRVAISISENATDINLSASRVDDWYLYLSRSKTLMNNVNRIIWSETHCKYLVLFFCSKRNAQPFRLTH